MVFSFGSFLNVFINNSFNAAQGLISQRPKGHWALPRKADKSDMPAVSPALLLFKTGPEYYLHYCWAAGIGIIAIFLWTNLSHGALIQLNTSEFETRFVSLIPVKSSVKTPFKVNFFKI